MSQSFTRRLLVTVAILVLWRLAALIPIPGMDASALRALTSPMDPLTGVLERLSIVALGVIPLFNALILGELAKLCIPSIRVWSERHHAHGVTYNHTIIGIALAFAVFQAAGISSALEQMPNLVSEPGAGFRWTAIATLVAGTALVIWFAQIMTGHGLGHGFWWLLALPHLVQLPSMLAAVSELARTGSISSALLLFILLSTGLCIAAIGALALKISASNGDLSALLWPPILGPLLASYLLMPVWLFGGQPPLDSAPSLMSPGHPIGLAAATVCTAGIAYAYARLHGTPNPVVSAAALAAAVLGISAVISVFSMPWWPPAFAIVILTVLIAPIARYLRVPQTMP